MGLLMLACAVEGSVPEPATGLLTGLEVVGVGRVDLRVQDGTIVEVGQGLQGAGEDLDGAWVVPAWIDSHVHLAYLDAAVELAEAGIVAAVDLAAPIEFLGVQGWPLEILGSGPMVTAEGGYPTQGWGSAGYGLEVRGEDEARAAVVRLHEAGARLIKVPLTGSAELSEAELAAVADEAHARGLKVAVHALTDEAAARGAEVGFDVLAHTPTEALSPGTIQAWSDKAVISTLSAFGGSPTTVGNLRALEAAGATVLYGTDLGNTRTPAIDEREIALLIEAGLSVDEVIASGTSSPAAYWGLESLGALEEGKEASFLVLSGDPRLDPGVLSGPAQVYRSGAPWR
jgi:imidazolonepropionase-like amidohydrolase